MAEGPGCCHHVSLVCCSVSVAAASCIETPAGVLGTTHLGCHSSEWSSLRPSAVGLSFPRSPPLGKPGFQGPGEGSWEGQYQSQLSAPRACGDFSTLQIKLESALGSTTYSKGGAAIMAFPGYGDTLKCGFFGAKVGTQ